VEGQEGSAGYDISGPEEGLKEGCGRVCGQIWGVGKRKALTGKGPGGTSEGGPRRT
jgi:hypothetical protein